MIIKEYELVLLLHYGTEILKGCLIVRVWNEKKVEWPPLYIVVRKLELSEKYSCTFLHLLL